jgi:N-acetylneuraminic acid mutarotase
VNRFGQDGSERWRLLRRMLCFAPFFVMTGKLCSADVALVWQQLPALPDPVGFAGTFAGTSGGALIVAGGANFPGKMPWDGGRKIWYDTVFVLDRTDGAWHSLSRLPRPLGYGVSVTTREGVVCIGGSDTSEHVREVFLLSLKGRRLTREPLAPLPGPLANSCGAMVGRTIFVAGGTASPEATNAMRNFWALDLDKRNAAWRELEPWPGPARMLAVAASMGGAFYVVGGTDLAPDATGQLVRSYLRDAYCFSPGRGWKRAADLPYAAVAAPTPAPVAKDRSFLVIGGDDGSLVNFEPKSKHPGFPKRVLRYDAVKDQWSVVGEAPVSRATLPTAFWQGLHVMPSGEARPGVRSPEVWAVRTASP